MHKSLHYDTDHQWTVRIVKRKVAVTENRANLKIKKESLKHKGCWPPCIYKQISIANYCRTLE